VLFTPAVNLPPVSTTAFKKGGAYGFITGLTGTELLYDEVKKIS